MSPESMPAAEPEQAGMSEASRLSGIFFEPKKAFADIALHPRWVVPIALLILAGMAFSAAVANRIGWERVVRCRSSELDRTLENVTQELTREVYDEFILGLIRLERAIIANDMEGALMLCHEIHREVGLH